MSGATTIRPARSNSAPVASASRRASGDASTPAAHSTVRVGMISVWSPLRTVTWSGFTSVTMVPVRHGDAEARQGGGGLARQAGGVGPEDAIRPFQQQDAGAARLDGAEVVSQRPVRHLGDGPGQLHAGRPRADENERQPRLLLFRVRADLGRLEGVQDAAADFERVLDRLEAGGVFFPFGMVEVVMPGAGRHDQRVVADGGPGGQAHLAPVEVEADDFAHEDAGVALPAQQGAERRGDVGRRQAAGRHLIEQRLKEVEVAPVDQRHLDGGLAQGLGGVEAAEAAAHDDDAMLAFHEGVRPDDRMNKKAVGRSRDREGAGAVRRRTPLPHGRGSEFVRPYSFFSSIGSLTGWTKKVEFLSADILAAYSSASFRWG